MVLELDEQQARAGQLQVWQAMFALVDSMALRCAVELGVADIMHNQGHPLTLSQLASLLPSPPRDPAVLFRLMRFLVSKSLFSAHPHPESGETLYGLTPASQALIKSAQPNLAPMILYITHPYMTTAWQELGAGILHGETPYVRAHGVDLLLGSAAADPAFGAMFNEAMACMSKATIGALMETYGGGFKGLGSLVDVGGGTGAMIAGIVGLHPGVKGINFDLPQVVAGAPEHPGVTHVAGNMFESIPPADAIFMKNVLHCFGDEKCLKLLRNCRNVIPKTGKVIIVDVVLNPNGDSPLAEMRAKFDLLMFTYTPSGKERTEEEWKMLLKLGGFPSCNIINMPAIWSIIEAFPE